MATFDTLIDDLASRYGLGANARSLIKEVLTLISTSPGGLGGFLDKLKSAGLASDVVSWLGHPNAGPIAAGQVERVLGATVFSGIADRLGLTQGVASTALGYALPKIIGLADAGGRRSCRRARGDHQFSLAIASRGGGTGRAATARRLFRERAEPVQHHPLAVAGARRAGRRWPAFLFLVDAQPDALGPARRQCAGAATPPPSTVAQRVPAASVATAVPATSARARCSSASACSFDGRAATPPPPLPPQPLTDAQASLPWRPPLPLRRTPKRRLRRLRRRPPRGLPTHRRRLLQRRRPPPRRPRPQLLRQSQRLNQARPRPPLRRPASRSATTRASCARQALSATRTRRRRSSTHSTRSSARTK